MTKKRYALDKRFSCALSEAAYDRLRALNERYGFSNNYLLTFLLESLDEVADADRLDAMYRRKIEAFGAPDRRM